MNRCKECEYFKNDCGFSSVDAQLKLDGNFVACGQFKKMDMWDFIHSATKISFPDEVRSSWNLLFEYIYPTIKDNPDATVVDETVQCVRCGCNVEHHFECACGYDRAVFSEEDWIRDIEDNSDLSEFDKEFITNGYHLNPEI